MGMIAKHLAQDLEVHSQIQVTTISIEKGIWKLRDASGNVFSGKALILTPPVPQSLALLNAGYVSLGNPSKRSFPSSPMRLVLR